MPTAAEQRSILAEAIAANQPPPKAQPAGVGKGAFDAFNPAWLGLPEGTIPTRQAFPGAMAAQQAAINAVTPENIPAPGLSHMQRYQLQQADAAQKAAAADTSTVLPPRYPNSGTPWVSTPMPPPNPQASPYGMPRPAWVPPANPRPAGSPAPTPLDRAPRPSWAPQSRGVTVMPQLPPQYAGEEPRLGGLGEFGNFNERYR